MAGAIVTDKNLKCDRIDRTHVTIQQVEDVIRENLQTEATFQDWSYQEIGKGKGFVSCMISLRITWKSDDQKLPCRVVVKIPDLTNFEAANFVKDAEVSQKMVAMMAGDLKLMHSDEIKVYNFFDKSVPKSEWALPMARLFGCREITNESEPDGFLILEDLSEVAACADMSLGYDYKQAKALTGMLAKLHAWCLKNEHKWRNSGIGDDMEECQQRFYGLCLDGFDDFMLWIKSDKHREFFGDECLNNVEVLRQNMETVSKIYKIHKEYNLPDVLVHGDFWSNNILMCKDEDTSLPTDKPMAVIDWQTAYIGSPVEDLTRLFFMSCNNQLREQHEDDLLKYYYDQLTVYLGQEPPFNFGDFIATYEQMYVTFAGVFMPLFEQMEAMVKFLEDAKSSILRAIQLKEKIDKRNKHT